MESNDEKVMFDSAPKSLWVHPNLLDDLKKSWAYVFYEDVFCKIDESPFAVIFDDGEKLDFPIGVLLSLEYLRHVDDLTDQKIIEDLFFYYLVGYAVGQPVIGEEVIPEESLCYFRERIYQYCTDNPGREDFLFRQFVNLIHNYAEKLGKNLDPRGADTALFVDNLKKAGHLSFVYKALSGAVKTIPTRRLTGSLFKVITGDFKTHVLYDTKSSEGELKLNLLLNLCKEALEILKASFGMIESQGAWLLKRVINDPQDIKKPIPGPGKGP